MQRLNNWMGLTHIFTDIWLMHKFFKTQRLVIFLGCFMFIKCYGQNATLNAVSAEAPITDGKITPGAERMDVYLPLLRGKTVGIFANPTSMVGDTHLVDTLRKLGINVKVIFGPEHGFRGVADAG